MGAEPYRRMVSPCSSCQASGAEYLSRAGDPLCGECFSNDELAAAVAREGEARAGWSQAAAFQGLASVFFLGMALLFFAESTFAAGALLLLGVAYGVGSRFLTREAKRPGP